MDETLSISAAISKNDRDEEMSISRAAFEDARSRYDGRKNEPAISNEKIQRGDELLNTYVVRSDAIPGGMGSVWKVYHESWNVELAMKRPLPRYFAEAGEGSKQDFISECEYWVNLGLHPNIVSCYYVREIGGVPTIFSEWMNGGSLKDRILDGSLYKGTENEVLLRILDIAIQVVRGLRYSHENNLIHRDVKPGNLLLTVFWEAKVADFGLAKAQSLMSKEARSVGYTMGYCPKEQAEGEEAGAWMDVYAFAVTLLEMYAGKRLWKRGAEVKTHCGEYFEQTRIPVSDAIRELIRSCVTERIDDLKRVENTLLEEYRSVAGAKKENAKEGDYPRPTPETVTDTADSLNNIALSMLDLGKRDEAETIWEKALNLSPEHVYCLYNSLVLRWYQGKIDDLQVLDRLQELDANRKTEESREVLRAAEKCRGEDKAVEEAACDPNHPEDWPPEMKAIRSRIPVSIDRSVLETEGSEKRFYDPSGHHMVQITSANVRIWDLLSGQCIRELSPAEDMGKITFVYFEEEQQTLLLGSTVLYKEYEQFSRDPKVRRGVLRLYDLKSGRCIRTLQPGASQEFPPDEKPEEHCFGSAVMVQGQPYYCYPNEQLTCLRYRHPDMRAVPASYFISRIQDYEQVRRRHEGIRANIETAREELAKHNIEQAYLAVDRAYELLGDGRNDELSLLNAKLGRYGRICGIRGFRIEPLEDAAAEETKQKGKRDYTRDPYSAGIRVNNWHAVHVTEEGLRKNPILQFRDYEKKKDINVLRLNKEFFVEQDVVVSPDLRVLYLLGKPHGEVSHHLYAVDTVTGNIISRGVPVSKDSGIACISPDGKRLVLSEGNRLFTYTVTFEEDRQVSITKTSVDYDTGFNTGIHGVWFRPDSQAVYVQPGVDPVCSFDLEKGIRYSFYDDDFMSLKPDFFKNYNTLRANEKDSFDCLSKEEGNFRFVIDYAYVFPGWTDWHEDARPYLERFLLFHPQWTDEDFNGLMEELQMRSLGFIDPDGIKRKLEEIGRLKEKDFARRRKARLPGILLQLGEVK